MVRPPYRFLDLLDCEAYSTQSKTYNFKEYFIPMVRPSKSGLFLGSQARIYYPVYNDYNRTLTSTTVYTDMFDFGIGNDVGSNF